MIHEYELKYRTKLSSKDFMALTSCFELWKSDIFKINYTDHYFYHKGSPNHFMRFRDQKKGINGITFKEEKENILKRIEINFYGCANMATAQALKLLHEYDGYFTIKKKAVVLQVDSWLSDISWYQVNGKDRFIEIEFLGDPSQYNPNEELAILDSRIKNMFGDAITPEHSSLFKLFRPKDEEFLPEESKL